MPDAVIVSTARTPIGKAFRGAFNITHGAVLGGHVVEHAVKRAGIAPDEVEDVVQESFVRAFRALPKLRASSAFEPWLLSIRLLAPTGSSTTRAAAM